MSFRIKDGDNVHAKLGGAVHRAVGIHGWKTTIGGDQVVQVMFVIKPIPGSDDDIALDALRPLRFSVRQLALGHAIGPVSEIRNDGAAEFFNGIAKHGVAALSRLDSSEPRLL